MSATDSSMSFASALEAFKRQWIQHDSGRKKSLSVNFSVEAVLALAAVIEQSEAATMHHLEVELMAAADALLAFCKNSISVTSGCELFLRFVTRSSSRFMDFDSCKLRLVEQGNRFALRAKEAQARIAKLGVRFITDGAVIMICGFSRTVLSVLLMATQMHKHVTVIVAETRYNGTGYIAAKMLAEIDVPVTIILDSAVAYRMSDVDMVLFGAEGLVESGGIISNIGTYQMAIIASAMKKPVYVAAESFKFARLFPLSQRDLPGSTALQVPFTPLHGSEPCPEGVTYDNPENDYTPPEYITLLFTDIGVLTPSGVSDELIKLYYT